MDPITLAQAGPIAILLAAIVYGYRAFTKQDIVPGSLYRAAIERAERAETQAERNVEAIALVTATVQKVLDARANGATDASA